MRLAVLASGTGSILEAMVMAGIPVSSVIVDRKCRAIELAQDAGIEVELIERTDFTPTFDRDVYSGLVADRIRSDGTELAAMAGFGTILSGPVHEALPMRLLNTHPALLPAFPGWHAVRDAVAYGVKVTGCTVHLATAAVDHGPILAQEAVTVESDDTEASLHERIKVIERRLYPETIKAVLADPRLLDDAVARWEANAPAPPD